MCPLGQLTYLPKPLAANPFYPLMVRFARIKMGSIELLFTIESRLVRYSWLSLLILFALVLPRFEEVDYLSTAIRMLTLVYPFFFIWSLTRLGGIELMQLVLEAHWTSEVLASPVTNRDLSNGFVLPLWLVVRQYFLMTFFSLILYAFEAVVFLPGLYEDLVRYAIFLEVMFFSTIAWLVFLYIGRLWIEVRLRSGLLKGLSVLGLLLIGSAMFLSYLGLFILWPNRLTATPTLIALGAVTLFFSLASIWFNVKLNRHFRAYLLGQLDIDPLVYDQIDPRATAWNQDQ